MATIATNLALLTKKLTESEVKKLNAVEGAPEVVTQGNTVNKIKVIYSPVIKANGDLNRKVNVKDTLAHMFSFLKGMTQDGILPSVFDDSQTRVGGQTPDQQIDTSL
ncbi:hypothetical protein HAX54_036265 [Datura stramonium]|uniref:Uncharacterized protein n=1 Tax=Datura stramonium TaxID=4076 RepID=A0ABS8VHG8_DATST|nr:hypothetical protein [Datura stramonium]